MAIEIQDQAITEIYEDSDHPVARWSIDPVADMVRKAELQEAGIVGIQPMPDTLASRRICRVLTGDREVAGLVMRGDRNVQGGA